MLVQQQNQTRLTVAFWRAVICAAGGGLLLAWSLTSPPRDLGGGLAFVFFGLPLLILHPIVMFLLARQLRLGNRSAGLWLVIITFFKLIGWGCLAAFFLSPGSRFGQTGIGTNAFSPGPLLVYFMVVNKFIELVVYLLATTGRK